jgi:hypothetical protein
MSSWKDIAKKNTDNPIINIENEKQKQKQKTDNIELDLNDKIDYNKFLIQEELEPEILETYSRLVDVLDEGLYGYLFCENRTEKMKSFMKLVHKHIDYEYYIKSDSHEIVDNESDNVDEFHPWENKRNRFAYT